MRRFDPDAVEKGHIYSSIKEKEVVISFFVGKAENFLSGFDNRLQLDNQSRKHSGWHIITSMR